MAVSVTSATPVCSCKSRPFITFWQNKLHLTEQNSLQDCSFHFLKKKKRHTPQLSWMSFSSSWLLCPSPCKSQLLGQGQEKQREAQGISAKVLSLGLARPMHGISGEESPPGLLHSPLLAAAAWIGPKA